MVLLDCFIICSFLGKGVDALCGDCGQRNCMVGILRGEKPLRRKINIFRGSRIINTN